MYNIYLYKPRLEDLIEIIGGSFDRYQFEYNSRFHRTF